MNSCMNVNFYFIFKPKAKIIMKTKIKVVQTIIVQMSETERKIQIKKHFFFLYLIKSFLVILKKYIYFNIVRRTKR